MKLVVDGTKEPVVLEFSNERIEEAQSMLVGALSGGGGGDLGRELARRSSANHVRSNAGSSVAARHGAASAGHS